ncbi:MAG TPA: hypothetical protein VIY90_24255 [Steroidobacteraceae bacterium]
MIDDLGRQFDDFARGAIDSSVFEQSLLELCRTRPDRSWGVLALLDQFHRRRKLSAELCRTLRHKIERHVLGIERLTRVPRGGPGVAAERGARAPALPFQHLLADQPHTEPAPAAGKSGLWWPRGESPF